MRAEWEKGVIGVRKVDETVIVRQNEREVQLKSSRARILSPPSLKICFLFAHAALSLSYKATMKSTFSFKPFSLRLCNILHLPAHPTIVHLTQFLPAAFSMAPRFFFFFFWRGLFWFSFLNPLPASLRSATGAGPHQPLHLKPAHVHGRAGAGEHAEALQPGHFHSHPPWRQRNQPGSGLCQVRALRVQSHVLGRRILMVQLPRTSSYIVKNENILKSVLTLEINFSFYVLIMVSEPSGGQ